MGTMIRWALISVENVEIIPPSAYILCINSVS